MRYASVNGQWPADTNDGRDLKPTPEEALRGAQRLYRKALGRPFRGRMKLTSGNRQTWIRNGVFYVNPDEGNWAGGNGWHEIVHSISHLAARRLYPKAKPHDGRHAFIERELIKYVVDHGFLEGKLIRPKKEKPPVDQLQLKSDRLVAAIKRWETKRKRAENALKKLRRRGRRMHLIAA